MAKIKFSVSGEKALVEPRQHIESIQALHYDSRSGKTADDLILKKPKENTFRRSSRSYPGEKVKRSGKLGRISIILLIILLFGLIAGIVYVLASPANRSFNLNPFPLVVNQVLGQQATLNQTDGRVNVLIIGVDNRSNTLTNDLKEIGNTDTIIIASYDTVKQNLQFISIPRDFGLKFKFPSGYTDNYYKINAGVNLGANQSYPGGGAQLLKDSIFSITGLKINYTAIVNFEAFTQIIDALGGIEINVENTFCDAGYPAPGDKGIMTVKFIKGPQHMDGTTALEFARSRVHNECSNMTAGSPVFEGNDFRRAYRQQQVIAALKDKMTKVGTDIGKIQSIIGAVGSNVLTQMEDGEFSDNNKFDLQTIKAAYDLKDKIKNTYNFVLDPTVCGGTLIKETTINEQYFILPKSTSFAPLRGCIASYLNNSDLIAENAQVGVYNNGLGYSQSSELATQLTTDGYFATFYENISLKKFYNWPASTPILNPMDGYYIADLTGNKPKTLNALALKYHATIVQKLNLPVSIQSLNGVDILFIAGGANTTPAPIAH